MKNKTMKLLVLSCSVCISSVGLSSFVIGDIINNKYVAKNDIGDEPVAKILGKDELYSSVEKALDVAQSGDIVTVLPPNDSNYPAVTSADKLNVTIRKDCVVKPGVTLLIPTDSNSIISAESNLENYIKSMQEDDRSIPGGDYERFATDNEERYLRVTLTLADNVTLKNYGNIIVSGYLSGGADKGCIGQTYSSYSRIVLGKNSKIIQKTDTTYDASTANLYCFGYISESKNDNNSLVDLANGSLYIPFIVNDYRGFQLSWSMTAIDGALDKGSSPFNQFELRNIDSSTKISYNAKVFGIVNAYMEYSTYGIKQNFSKILNLVGNSNDCVFQLSDSKFRNDPSYLMYKYNKDECIADIDFYGGFKFNNLEIVFEAGAFGFNVSVVLSTTKSYFPLSYRFNITLNKLKSQTNCNYDFSKQKIKILPGCIVRVNENCSIEADEIVVYDAFFDGTIGNGPGTSCMYNEVKYPQLEGGVFIVDNTSTINAIAIAGTVYCDTPSNITAENDSICSLEPWQCKNNPNFSISPTSKEPAWAINEFLYINEKLNIVPLDNIDKKKIFVGINCFDLSFTPSVDVLVTHSDGSEETISIDTYQKTLFFDDIVSYKLDFKKDISKAYKFDEYYSKGDVVVYDVNKPSIILINSSTPISSDLDGVNEFNVQSIDIECLTETIDGVIPLFPNKTIALEANVVDLNKVYNKTITWESLTPETASVDNNGIVTGISLGKAIIQATCDGKSAVFETEVIDESSIDVPILTEAVVSERETNTQGKFEIETKETVRYVFKVDILEIGAPITNITWQISGGNVGVYHNLIDPTTNEISTSKTVSGMYREVTAEFSDPGIRADNVTITCKVSNDVTEVTGTINIEISQPPVTCLLGSSRIMLANGEYKLAKDLKCGDKILSYNHFNGEFESRKILFNAVLTGEFEIIKLEFADGHILTVASGHGLFNVTKNKYEIYNGNEFYKHIGEEFVVVSSSNGINSLSSSILVNVSIKNEKTTKYSPVSEYNINCIADDVLTIPDDIEGMFDGFEFSSLENKLKIDIYKFESLIEKYGVYSYSEVVNVIPNYLFHVLNFKYFKTFIGAGVLSTSKINYWIGKYAKNMCDFNNLKWDFENRKKLK